MVESKLIPADKNTATHMTRICAWCKKVIGEVEGHGSTGETHGICPECAEILRKEIKKKYAGNR